MNAHFEYTFHFRNVKIHVIQSYVNLHTHTYATQMAYNFPLY